ncbi:MAG: hypothetical protein HY391_02065 [Deltaproteobacteria bacterium]|nr:hypothetical protein [Deltaproteobacteria bacterium]
MNQKRIAALSGCLLMSVVGLSVFGDDVKLRQRFDPSDHIGRGDYDEDGLPNQLDPDLDGDFVPNVVDQYPIDRRRWGEDEDYDNIPDWVDYAIGGRLKAGITERMAEIQLDLACLGIFVFDETASFSEDELEIIERAVRDPLQLKPFLYLSTLHAIVKRAGRGSLKGRFGDYHQYWNYIVLYEGAWEPIHPERLRNVLFHEWMHAVAKQYPRKYEEFLKVAGWSIYPGEYYTIFEYLNPNGERVQFAEGDFELHPDRVKTRIFSEDLPSEEAKLGPQEMFAEVGTASLLLRLDEAPQNDRYHLASFRGSPLQDFFQKAFLTE